MMNTTKGTTMKCAKKKTKCLKGWFKWEKENEHALSLARERMEAYLKANPLSVEAHFFNETADALAEYNRNHKKG